MNKRISKKTRKILYKGMITGFSHRGIGCRHRVYLLGWWAGFEHRSEVSNVMSLYKLYLQIVRRNSYGS